MHTQVEIWNVGHGDAIRINFDNKFFVLRDFGRHNQAKETITSVDEFGLILCGFVAPCFPEAILTHPHRDHFSGFLMLKDIGLVDIFNKVYVPWLDFRTLRALGCRMSILAAYLYSYHMTPLLTENFLFKQTPKNLLAVENIRRWIEAAPTMNILGKNFFGVSAGHRFKWPLPATVLWPPDCTHNTFLENRADLIHRWTGHIEEKLGSNNRWLIDKIRHTGDEITSILSKYYQETFISNEESQNDLARINETLSGLAEIEIPKTSELRYLFDNAFWHFSNCVDDNSIVFEISTKALFLSDLRSGAMNVMARDYIVTQKKYNLLKSSHHGTRIGKKEFKRLVKSGTIIHTWGPANSNYGTPTNEYCNLLNPNKIIYTEAPVGVMLPHPPCCTHIFNGNKISITI